MKKSQKLRFCNWSLLVLMVLTLASSIQLEVTGSKGFAWVIVHVIVAILFIAFCFYHIKLHFNWSRWFFKFSKIKSIVTKILWWLLLITSITGCIALIRWLITDTHSIIGGIHGKFGLLMIAFAIGHTIKRYSFFTRNHPAKIRK